MEIINSNAVTQFNFINGRLVEFFKSQKFTSETK